MTRYRIGVDTGGTFTDLLAFDAEKRTLLSVKVPSTPESPQNAVLGAFGRTAVSSDQVAFFGHSSTVALNALLQRAGSRTGLVTTAGFRDVLEIGRFNRPRMYDLFYTKPPPLVRRNLRAEVEERIGAEGTVITPLDEKEMVEVVESLTDAGVESLAICFVNAFRNPVHERRAAEIIRDRFSKLTVVASFELVREWREFERTSTTVMSAYLGPVTERYVEGLDASLQKQGCRAPLLVTRSDGGLMGAGAAVRAPVATLMSGPAAAVQGAARLGQVAGHPNLITLDIGGTSCDVSLVTDGAPALSHEASVAGLPLLGSIVDVHSIGAGGGTIAWVDGAGRLRVGPTSAGASPGPACYAQGGSDPTVTDAYVVLGLLDPDGFLGGEMRLDAGLAGRAVEAIAQKVSLSPEACALGIIRILEAQMVGSLRLVSIERGHDPREFTLFACGGAGGMHAASLARELDIPRVISPQLPAHLAPWGILTSDLRETFSRTYGRLLSQLNDDALEQSIAELREEGAARLSAEGFDPGKVVFRSHLELRYVGQRHTVKVPFEPNESPLEKMGGQFHRAHEELYGYSRPQAPVELVTLRLDAEGILEKPKVERLPEGKPGRARKGTRQVWLDSDGPTEATIYDRELLVSGERIDGPAIIQEAASSTLLHAGQTMEVNAFGMLVIGV